MPGRQPGSPKSGSVPALAPAPTAASSSALRPLAGPGRGGASGISDRPGAASPPAAGGCCADVGETAPLPESGVPRSALTSAWAIAEGGPASCRRTSSPKMFQPVAAPGATGGWDSQVAETGVTWAARARRTTSRAAASPTSPGRRARTGRGGTEGAARTGRSGVWPGVSVANGAVDSAAGPALRGSRSGARGSSPPTTICGPAAVRAGSVSVSAGASADGSPESRAGSARALGTKASGCVGAVNRPNHSGSVLARTAAIRWATPATRPGGMAVACRVAGSAASAPTVTAVARGARVSGRGAASCGLAASGTSAWPACAGASAARACDEGPGPLTASRREVAALSGIGAAGGRIPRGLRRAAPGASGCQPSVAAARCNRERVWAWGARGRTTGSGTPRDWAGRAVAIGNSDGAGAATEARLSRSSSRRGAPSTDAPRASASRRVPAKSRCNRRSTSVTSTGRVRVAGAVSGVGPGRGPRARGGEPGPVGSAGIRSAGNGPDSLAVTGPKRVGPGRMASGRAGAGSGPAAADPRAGRAASPCVRGAGPGVDEAAASVPVSVRGSVGRVSRVRAAVALWNRARTSSSGGSVAAAAAGPSPPAGRGSDAGMEGRSAASLCARGWSVGSIRGVCV